MAILDYVYSGNLKESVARTYHQDEPRIRTYHQDEPWKARHARQALDLRHSSQAPLQS